MMRGDGTGERLKKIERLDQRSVKSARRMQGGGEWGLAAECTESGRMKRARRAVEDVERQEQAGRGTASKRVGLVDKQVQYKAVHGCRGLECRGSGAGREAGMRERRRDASEEGEGQWEGRGTRRGVREASAGRDFCTQVRGKRAKSAGEEGETGRVLGGVVAQFPGKCRDMREGRGGRRGQGTGGRVVCTGEGAERGRRGSGEGGLGQASRCGRGSRMAQG